jgi:hypothetical protein
MHHPNGVPPLLHASVAVSPEGRRSTRLKLLIVTALLGVSPLRPVNAQEAKAPEVGFSSIPFQFFPPGARSLAMGGTFVGIADDATAAASNPAGLIILTKPETSVHGRFTSFSTLTEAGYTSPSTSKASLSYASVVVPFKPVSLSVYYQQVSNFDIDRQFSGDVLFQSQTDSTRLEPTPFASRSHIDILVEDLGLSAGLKLGRRLSVGATVARRRLKLTYLENTLVSSRGFTDEASATEQTDDGIVFNAGVLLNPNGRVSLGLVFKRGGEFEIPYVVDYDGSLRGPISCPLPGTCTGGALRIPDTWGIGVGFRPSSRWLFAADAALVRYSQLSPTVFRFIPYDIYPPQTTALPPTEFDDIVQLNAGFERIFPGRQGHPTVGLRGGIYHRPNFNRNGTLDAGATFGTVGLGLVFGDRGQLDLAGSFSGGSSEGLASLVIRF